MAYRRRYRYRRGAGDDLAELVGVLFLGIFYLAKLSFKFGGWLYDNNSNLKKAFKINIGPPPGGEDLKDRIRVEHVEGANNASEKLRTIHSESIKSPVEIAQTEPNGRYTLRSALLTKAEQNFLDVLTKVVDGRYVISAQVQLSRIVTPTDSNKNFVNYADFNRIKAKSIDFVLYDGSYKPVLCIELDDRSHLRWDRIRRDVFVDDVMSSVGLRILHVPSSYSYDESRLKSQIFSKDTN